MLTRHRHPPQPQGLQDCRNILSQRVSGGLWVRAHPPNGSQLCQLGVQLGWQGKSIIIYIKCNLSIFTSFASAGHSHCLVTAWYLARGSMIVNHPKTSPEVRFAGYNAEMLCAPTVIWQHTIRMSNEGQCQGFFLHAAGNTISQTTTVV